MPRGGKRTGAGRRKGSKEAKTLEREASRQLLRELVMENMRPLVEAQVANAQGIKYLVVRDKRSGRFLRRYEAGSKLNKDVEIIEVWEKDPSVHAFSDLMDRLLDRPAQHVAMEHGGSIAVKWDE